MNNIYEDTLKAALTAIANGSIETTRQKSQRLLAENIVSFLSGHGLNVSMVRSGIYFDIFIHLFSTNNTPECISTVRVFSKLDNDIIQNFKLKYLPSMMTEQIDGNKREWVEFTSDNELIDLIKREMFDVYVYNMKK